MKLKIAPCLGSLHLSQDLGGEWEGAVTCRGCQPPTGSAFVCSLLLFRVYKLILIFSCSLMQKWVPPCHLY